MIPQVKILLPKDMGARTWGTELLVAHGPGYVGKILRMKAGEAGGLQLHREKHETSYLVSGEAWVITDLGEGGLTRCLLSPGASVEIPPGAVHKVQAITDCVFAEFSTPHFDDRVRMEAAYGLPDTGGLPTTRA